MHKIEIGSEIVKHYPERIDEMTPAQFVEFASLVFMYQTKQITYDEFTVKLTYKLLDMKRRVDIHTHPDSEKITENINIISKLNEAFFDTKIENGKQFKVINLDFVKNLLPKIKVDNRYYYGPADALTNTSFGEYVSALNSYIDFSESGNEEDLNLMVASLYRPIDKRLKTQSDKRFAFDENELEYYANKIKHIPFNERFAIYLWFSACQKFIVTNKELRLSGGVVIDLSVLFNSGSSGEKGIGMAGVIFSMAETGVFGNADQTAKKNTYVILSRMVQTYLQAKKMERDAKNR